MRGQNAPFPSFTRFGVISDIAINPPQQRFGGYSSNAVWLDWGQAGGTSEEWEDGRLTLGAV